MKLEKILLMGGLSLVLTTASVEAAQQKSLIEQLLEENKQERVYELSPEFLKLRKDVDALLVQVKREGRLISVYNTDFDNVKDLLENQRLVTRAENGLTELEKRIVQDKLGFSSNIFQRVIGYKTDVAKADALVESEIGILASALELKSRAENFAKGKDYKTALDMMDKLVPEIKKIEFVYDKEMKERLTNLDTSGDMPLTRLRAYFISGSSAGKIISEMTTYRDQMANEIIRIKETVDQGYEMLASFDSTLRRGSDVSSLLTIESKCESLLRALSVPPYNYDRELRKKAESYKNSAFSKLSKMSQERVEYFRSSYAEMQKIRNQGNLSEYERRLDKLKGEMNKFKKSPLSDPSYTGEKRR